MQNSSTDVSGYDPDFLAVGVPFPAPPAGSEIRELPYTHFTVLLDPIRRLAVSTGVNIDGETLRDVERANDWQLDPRIPEHEQTGEAVYARNDLDRGHLVRRRDPVWGDSSTATRANSDTFFYPNAAPQAGSFNQSKELWLGLEDHVLEHARENGHRINVFTGPVLEPDDLTYRGIAIPQSFWKIAAWTSADDESIASLHAAGFVLDQRPQLENIDLSQARASALASGDPPPLGPYRTYQVPIPDIGRLTGLEVELLSESDALLPVAASRLGDSRPRSTWKALGIMNDVTLSTIRRSREG